MPRISTDQLTVLQAVMARLIAEVPTFNASSCFLADDTEPNLSYESNLHAVVTPMGGTFDEEWMVGGGAEQCKEDTGAIITVWSQMKLDRKQRIETSLMNADRGLLPIKKAILKAFTGHDLVDIHGNQLLTALMMPVSAKHRRRANEGKSIGFSLSFSTDFLWDLT